MKFLKLDDRLIEEIIANKSGALGILDDRDDISVNDDIEFFNTSNVVFGAAKIRKLISQEYQQIKLKDPKLLLNLKVVGDLSSDSQLIKIIYFDFTKYKEPHKAINSSNLATDSLKIYADGGSRGNPGPSASGYVLMTVDDQVIKQRGVYLGITTNNQAEYKALLFALEDALELGSNSVLIFMDSLLVINQLKGVYKVKNSELLPIYRQIVDLLTHFQNITLTHVPRELNKLADAEVNKCLDASITS
ncbi:MAG TPA: ribonuclease HI family protein [Candidatus Saccharimonadia bacterium]|nr:ribonuclease HI family protein [Candidatus Saccharimonadia bacterium]